jgi:hypothetical protein
MEIQIVEEVCSELKQLLLKQTEMRKAQTFRGLTEVELLEYEQGYEHIRELCAKLLTTESLAA